jgi:hypothetical protein
MVQGKILKNSKAVLTGEIGQKSTHNAHSQQPQTNLRRRGALLVLAKLHGPDVQLCSPDPLKTFYRLPRDPPPPLPLRAW